MFCQLFGKYLIEMNVITKDEYEDIILALRNTRIKIGFLAIEEGYLTETEVKEIHRLQAIEDAKFGEIAVNNNFLSKEQLDKLLSMQEGDYVKFIQLLCEDKGLFLAEINGYIEDFRKRQGFDENELEALKHDEFDKVVPMFAFASKPFVTDLVGLMLRNITRFVSTDFYIDRIIRVKQADYKSFVTMELKGDADIHIGFLADDNQDGMLLIANRYADEQYTEANEDVYDAVGEFINCISGLFATNICQKRVKVEIFPQHAYENQSAMGDAYVLPLYIEDKKILFYIAINSEVKIGEDPIEGNIEVLEGSPESEDSKGSVVIVDDSSLSRKILRTILEENGYTVVCEAIDGIEGVDAYKEYKPDLITLDITMPRLTGNGALKEIMEYDSNANVIMITAAGQEDKILEALKCGAKRFITKPFLAEDIMKNITEVLG